MPQRTHRYWSRASTKSLTCWDGLDLPISVFVLGLAPRVRRLLILLLRLLESLLRLLESLLILLLRLLETRLLGLGFRAQHRNGAGRDIPILIPFPSFSDTLLDKLPFTRTFTLMFGWDFNWRT